MLDSPLHAIAALERDEGIPAGFVNRVVVTTGATGAWARLERGEIAIEAFYVAFDRECASAGHSLSAQRLMQCIALASQPRPAMLAAVHRIRERGLRAAALTNNWVGEGEGVSSLRPHFDVFVESSVVGLRKPDPRIYEHACRCLSIEAHEAVFLDDIGSNLKTARALGMTTIKVTAPEQALAELETVLGFDLRERIPRGDP